MVLIGLLYKSFIENLSNFPSHVIHVRKQDVLNIESIHYEYAFSGVELTNSTTIDFSRLVKLELDTRNDLAIKRESAEITIEGLPSLKNLYVAIKSLETNFSIRNLPSVKIFHLYIPRIDENILSPLFDQLQNIEELSLHGDLNYFNLDNLVNLRRLCLDGTLNAFNFELFKNVSLQLEELAMFFRKIDYEIIIKLFYGHKFPNIQLLNIDGCNMRRIEKTFIDRFPNLLKCRITNCCIETIEDNAFSNLKDLYLLDLSENLLKRLYKRDFSGLVNLKSIILHKNRINFFENGIFSHMKNLEFIYLNDNKFVRYSEDTKHI